MSKDSAPDAGAARIQANGTVKSYYLATTRFLDGATESHAETLAVCGVDVSPSRYVTEFVLVFEYGDGTAEDFASRH